MSTPYAIANFKGIVHYDHATETFTVQGGPNGWKAAQDAAERSIELQNPAISDPEGEHFQVKVVYKDADYDTPALVDFEELAVSYSNNLGTITFTRETTYESSEVDSGAVTFLENTDLYIFGVAGAVQFRKLTEAELITGTDTQHGLVRPVDLAASISSMAHVPDIRLLQEETVYESGNLVTSTSTSHVRMSDSLVISPTDAASELVVDCSINYQCRRTSTGTGVLSHSKPGHVLDVSGVDTDTEIGTEMDGGPFFLPADDDMTFTICHAHHFTLDQTQLNTAGDWEIIPMFRCASTGREVRGQLFNVHYREILKP